MRPGDSPRPTDLGTQTMVCNHGNPSRLKLVYDLEESDFDRDFAVLTLAEWNQLQTMYVVPSFHPSSRSLKRA